MLYPACAPTHPASPRPHLQRSADGVVEHGPNQGQALWEAQAPSRHAALQHRQQRLVREVAVPGAGVGVSPGEEDGAVAHLWVGGGGWGWVGGEESREGTGEATPAPLLHSQLQLP